MILQVALACTVAVVDVGAQAPERATGPPAGAAPAAASAAPGQAAAPQRFVRGYLVSRYWLRWTGDDSDQDLYEALSLDVGIEDRDAITGHFYGRVAGDLDGGTGGSTFFSANDSIGGRVDGRVYDAYADLRRVPGLSRIRVGRQMIHETPELAYFDGVAAETQPITKGELQVGVYGGVSSHLYESSASGDWTAGLYAQARPWTGGRMRLDWMHLEDEVLLGAHNNDLFAAGFWQTIAQLQLEGQYSRVEGRDRDVRTRLAYTDAQRDLMGQVTYYQLLRTQKDLVLELDPFFNALREEFPYWQAGALLDKGLSPHLHVLAGADVRRVADAGDIGAFNRDYERWYATGSVRDLPVTGLSVSATADFWHSDQEDVRTWGAEVEQRFFDRTTIAAGSYYSLYKFDLFLNGERDHVRTYYARLQHKPSPAVSVDLKYELEETDFDDFHVLRMGVTWHF